MKVCKFGGSSVADENQIKKVRAILEADPDRTIVVVSAPGKRDKADKKITDMLYECVALASDGRPCHSVFKDIAKRYMDIAKGLDVEAPELEKALLEVERNIDAGLGKDYAGSRGEYLNAVLISKYLGWEFVDAQEYVIINEDGTVDPETYVKLSQRFKADGHYCMPGFYGATKNGMVKTFSRGGSDISGAIAARAADAEIYENWTDVSGMLAADPRVVENPKVIEFLTYKQVRELAEVGASVFHEEAIAPVIPIGVKINIRNTNRPEDPGTMIVPELYNSELVGVSAKGGFTRVSIRKLLLFKKRGVRHAFFTALHLFGITPSFSFFGVDSIVILFPSIQASDKVVEDMCIRLKKDFQLDEVNYERAQAVVGIVGGRMNNSTAFIDAAEALKKSRIAINFVNHGASEVSTLFGIRDADKERAVEAIYNELFA